LAGFGVPSDWLLPELAEVPPLAAAAFGAALLLPPLLLHPATVKNATVRPAVIASLLLL
jgi:hypothetical protein